MLLALGIMLSMQPADVRPDCDGNTLEINACLSDRLERAQERLDAYRQAALDRHGGEEGNEDAVNLGIRASEDAFEAYRSIECRTVYENWKQGTIRGAMNLSCLIRLTDERTHTIWRNWLHYADSTPPILPEPRPTD